LIRRLHDASILRGLKINKDKTKFLASGETGEVYLMLNGNQIERFESYIYLGRLLSMSQDLNKELDRRAKAAWTSYSRVSDVLRGLNNPDLRARLFDSTILPALKLGHAQKHTYAASLQYTGHSSVACWSYTAQST
jgi:hypothetical protein